MTSRSLTEDEISSFRWRHPDIFLLHDINPFDVFPPEGRIIQDDTLGGYVLIFQKEDGSKIYALMDSDPTEGDPSLIGYVINETISGIIENTKNVLPKLPSPDDIKTDLTLILAIAGIAVFFMYIAPTLNRK